VLAHDRDHFVFTFDRFFTMVWRRETRIDAVKRVNRVITEFATSLAPQRFCLLTLVEAGAPLPPAGSRAGLAHLLHANAEFLVASAVAFEGSGFRAAAVRGVATSIAVMSNHQFPHRIFSSVLEATDFLTTELSDELGGRVDGRKFLGTLQSLRAGTPSA
jgi:hypothetical protein